MTDSTNSSRKVVVTHRGSPDVLEICNHICPEPESDEVRVQVEAIGVSAYDVMLRGHRFPGFPKLPYSPGEDIVGIVDAVGSTVTNFKVGQRVGGWTFGDGGGYAEYICRPANKLVAVPEGLDSAVAVATITNYLTAHLALHQAVQVRSGESILVQGAGGGLGSAILQLSRIAGLEAYGSDSFNKHSSIKADGAIPIDYQSDSVIKRVRELKDDGVDTVIDLIGGPGQLLVSYRALAHDGRLLMLGMAGSGANGTKIIIPSLVLLAVLSLWPDKRRVVYGPGLDNYPSDHPEWYGETLAQLFDHVLNGRLAPRIACRIPLTDVSRAHIEMESGNICGKVVLVTEAYKPPELKKDNVTLSQLQSAELQPS